MKKTLLITIIIAMMGIGAAYAGSTQTLSFNDGNGTPNAGNYMSTDTITLDINLTFAGYSSYGLVFLAGGVQNGIAPFLRITSITYGTAFPSPYSIVTNAFSLIRHRRFARVHVRSTRHGFSCGGSDEPTSNRARHLLGCPHNDIAHRMRPQERFFFSQQR